jgi:hypothetical protein
MIQVTLTSDVFVRHYLNEPGPLVDVKDLKLELTHNLRFVRREEIAGVISRSFTKMSTRIAKHYGCKLIYV